MKSSLFLGIFAFVLVGMLIFTASLAFAEGHYLLGAIRVMLIIFNCFFGWKDLEAWKEGR